MDLVRRDDEESATADLIACQSLDLGDFFVFVIQKAGQITEEQDGGAVRYRVRALQDCLNTSQSTSASRIRLPGSPK